MTHWTRWLVTVGSIAAAVVVLGAAIAQAVRQGSLTPIWLVGWIPVVVVAGLYRPGSRRARRPRKRQRAESEAARPSR
jgi:hypothetical protein